MNGHGFDVSQLTDFGQEILEVATKDMPKLTERFMKSEAQRLRNKAKKKARTELKSHKAKEGKSYIERMKAGKKVYAYGDAKYNVMVYNTAPHAHLIEDGHKMVTHKGEIIGFVPGKHILENSTIAFEETFLKDIETKLASKVIKEMEK